MKPEFAAYLRTGYESSEEAAPKLLGAPVRFYQESEILRTLGIADRLSKAQKQ